MRCSNANTKILFTCRKNEIQKWSYNSYSKFEGLQGRPEHLSFIHISVLIITPKLKANFHFSHKVCLVCYIFSTLFIHPEPIRLGAHLFICSFTITQKHLMHVCPNGQSQLYYFLSLCPSSQTFAMRRTVCRHCIGINKNPSEAPAKRSKDQTKKKTK